MGDPLRLIAGEPVAVLGTVGADDRPHLVPVVFAIAGTTIVTAVDWKPKTGRRLRRLANIEADPRVTFLVHHYTDDWDELWWVRVDGKARIHAGDSTWETAVAALREKYSQYRDRPPQGEAIVIEPGRIRAWPDGQ